MKDFSISVLIKVMEFCVAVVAIGTIISISAWMNMFEKPIRVSRASLDEVNFNPKCSGAQMDVSVNEKYVYANCPGGPVTVENYKFK